MQELELSVFSLCVRNQETFLAAPKDCCGELEQCDLCPGWVVWEVNFCQSGDRGENTIL